MPEMAQQRNQADELKFCCSVCLDLLKDPVTIPCGHNYCMNCIKDHWDVEEEKMIYSCPQCRQTFTPRPVLMKNNMLADLVEELKNSELQAAPADPCYAGPEDVACDVCTGRKRKGLKSCLVCLASYCDEHLQPHYESPAFKKHKLVEPSVKLQDTVCPRHDEVMKMFCRTDQQCICYLCTLNEHKGHDTVSAAAERTERQRELEGRRQNIQQRIQDREKYVKVLQQELENISRSADKAIEYSEKIFTELIRLMERRHSDVKQQVRYQQQTEVSRVLELQEKLEQEITELKRKDAELKKLSHTEDHSQFLHNYPSVSQLPDHKDSPRPKVDHLWYIENMMASVTAARNKIQKIFAEKWPSVEPTTRSEFLKYLRGITLDSNTVHAMLVLSEGNRKVTFNTKNMPYPDHPDRFSLIPQVLSKEELTGRCYWEVERSRNAGVAVAYKSIGRSGDFNTCAFGYNEKSWILFCDNGYIFRHNQRQTDVSGPKSSRIGVYLDHHAGILSFYSVTKTMTLLHRVQTTFTQPLYAGLCLSGRDGDTAELCMLV